MANIRTDDEKQFIETLNHATEVMDKKKVKILVRGLKEASDAGDLVYLQHEAKPVCAEVLTCLVDGAKDVSEEVLKRDKARIKDCIKTDGHTELNDALLRNVEAKLGIIKYKEKLEEAVNAQELDDYKLIGQSTINFKRIVVVGGTILTLGTFVLIASLAANSKKNKNNNTNNTTGLTSGSTTIGSETLESTETLYSEETINETFETNSGYTLSTIAPTYEAETRAPEETDENGNRKPNINSTETTRKINETTPNNAEVVIVKPTDGTEYVSYETSSIPTNEDGNKVDDNGNPVESSYIAPDGDDELPIEPTYETIDISKLKVKKHVLVYKNE